ncbi:ATP synthase subunit I [Brotaphodocola catenula]|uniref:ATP synthase subunit I n=1 Tax=Brotaphodocola catenula TaxID=2885361 RepID=A0AAE3DJB8_9FIRM|nr:ATP synthase subunit I [Brotaphodocola catenula]MCC2164209.1 ATP synthase subunit I [Brotaphodocola catenula]
MIQVQDAVKKETARIGAGTAGVSVVMILVFWGLHLVIPDSIPFDYKVILGAVIGSAVAVGNFFFMGLTVQKIADMQDQDLAYRRMKTSYHYRTMIQFLWIILAVTVPFINGVAGIIPLFVPGAVIKARGILGTIKTNK